MQFKNKNLDRKKYLNLWNKYSIKFDPTNPKILRFTKIRIIMIILKMYFFHMLEKNPTFVCMVVLELLCNKSKI